MNTKITLNVSGMHCKSCAYLIENTAKELDYIKNATINLDKKSLTLEYNNKKITQSELINYLNKILNTNNYFITTNTQKNTQNNKIFFINYKEFQYALPIASIFILIFLLLQLSNIFEFNTGITTNLSTAFIIGIFASLSTCMAIVGGLLLSITANYAKDGKKYKPQIFFHIGRILAFFILGGIIGSIGNSFTISITTNLILGLIVGITMLILGFNLLDIYHPLKKIQITIPNYISRFINKIFNINSNITPFLIGIATFFLPCGFTQSMQIFTLQSGSFLNGGLTMLSFALGTLPVLAAISFSSLTINPQKSGIFYKTAGIIVIFFAILNIYNSINII